MTIDDVADALQPGRRSVYRLAQRGELPGREVLGRWRLPVKDVDARLRNRPAMMAADRDDDDKQYAIIQQHRGKIVVESQAGRGTLMSVGRPAAAVTADTTRAARGEIS